MKYLLLLILPYIASFFTNLFSKNNLSIYDKIKPVWQPPGFIFGIVWFILYLFNGLSTVFVLNDNNVKYFYKKITIVLFLLQIFIENLWVFFTNNYVKKVNNWQLYILIILNVLILKKVLFFSYINQILPAILSSFEIIWILFAISFISYRIGYFKNI